jgi:hypothetical protein
MRNILGISAKWVSGRLARAAALAFVIASPAQGTLPVESKPLTILDRVERIRATIGERGQSAVVGRAAATSDVGAATNWPNWNKWPKWPNWNNWGNWRNI